MKDASYKIDVVLRIKDPDVGRQLARTRMKKLAEEGKSWSRKRRREERQGFTV